MISHRDIGIDDFLDLIFFITYPIPPIASPRVAPPSPTPYPGPEKRAALGEKTDTGGSPVLFGDSEEDWSDTGLACPRLAKTLLKNFWKGRSQPRQDLLSRLPRFLGIVFSRGKRIAWIANFYGIRHQEGECIAELFGIGMNWKHMLQ